MFKIRSGTAPDYLGEFFNLASSVHGDSTRFRDNGSYKIPQVKGFGKNPLSIKVVCSRMIYLFLLEK